MPETSMEFISRIGLLAITIQGVFSNPLLSTIPYVECKCHSFRRCKITISGQCWIVWFPDGNSEEGGWQWYSLWGNSFETQDCPPKRWLDTSQTNQYQWRHGTIRETRGNSDLKYQHRNDSKWVFLVGNWTRNCSLSIHYAIPRTFLFPQDS